MHFWTKINRKIKKILHGFFSSDKHSKYISRISRNAPWILIAYIPDVFYHQNNIEYIQGHQNKREALFMVPILNKLGYNVYVRDYKYPGRLPNLKINIIFGHSPLIERAAKKFPKAKLIMYATGCLYTHQNTQEKYITDIVNSKYGTSFPYERWVPPYTSHITSDKILLIGCKSTIETFPPSLRDKISTIHQSSQDVPVLNDITYSPDNNFFFMSSGGVLLRGVSFLIEYFSSHQDKILHLVCPIEPYLQFIKEKTPANIIFHGTLYLGSNKMLEIMSKCNYMIYPSGSDAAPSGSVINSMRNGLIPIVSRWAAFDEIDKYGYMLRGWDVKSVGDGIRWADSIPPEICKKMKQNCARFARETYNIDNFSKEFESFFKENFTILHK